MELGLTIKIVWWDNDMIEFLVRASNGTFAGTAQFYDSHDTLSELATAFDGFPTSSDDNRMIQLGSSEPGGAGGGVVIRLGCVDQLGHSVAAVSIRSDRQEFSDAPETARFIVPVEPAAIDQLVVQLRTIPLRIGAVAQLRSTASRCSGAPE